MATIKAKAARPAEEAVQAFESMASVGQERVKENIDRTVAAFSEMSAFGKDNVEAFIASATATSKGMEALSQRAVHFSKQAMENHMAAAKAMMSSKSVQEFVERQSEYAQNVFNAYLAEVNQMSELMAGVAKEAARPLNDRVQAVSTLMQNSQAR